MKIIDETKSLEKDLTTSDQNKNEDDNDAIEIYNDAEDEYEISGFRSLFDDLLIELDDEKGTKIPRYNSSCHKCNLAVRKAINCFPTFAKDLAKLNRFAKEIRKSNLKSVVFKLAKSRIRCETRWSSSFLTLLSFYKA